VNPFVLLQNPQVADKVFAAAGYATALGNKDVRELSQLPVPLWTIVAGTAILSFGLGIYASTKLPRSWACGNYNRKK
jgi:hypothetical protein